MIPIWVVVALCAVSYVIGMASFVVFDAMIEQRHADRSPK